MTDYTDLIARLTHRPPTLKDIREAADALEAQAEEIQNLENRLRVALDAVKEDTARIAELEDKLKDEEYISKDTDEMFHEVRDENIELRARIAELEAALKETLEIAEQNELGDYQQRARAAYRGEKE